MFQSINNPIECEWKRLIVNGSSTFQWEPGLTINGETCISTVLVEFNDEEPRTTINIHKLVESIRLAWIGT